MPPILRPPNRLEILGFPAFSMSWYGDPADGTSIVAYSGGGGSARTGVGNKVGVTVNDQAEPRIISTGTKVGIAIHIYANPLTKRIWMLVSLESEVQRYTLPDECTLDGSMVMAESGCNCLAVNAMADRMALGLENGTVEIHKLSDSDFNTRKPLFVCAIHTNAVCAVNFAQRGDLLLSSAKDGTVCVWKQSTGDFLTQVKCDVTDPTAKRRQTQIMVRGCAFGDMEGSTFYAVASGRRGKAFLSKWVRGQGRLGNYSCKERTAVSDFPVSSMSLSQDGGLLVLGSVDGNATLWRTSEWKPIKIFKEVHGLPLTCVAPRPYPVPLKGEDDGVVIHARTASADGTLACLTLQRHVPKVLGVGSVDNNRWMRILHRIFMTLLFCGVFSPLWNDMVQKCDVSAISGDLLRCILEEVIVAPSSRPGISSPPY